MKILKLAAVDIGSNAIRLLIHNIIVEEGKAPKFLKNAIVRVPVRLGEDSFNSGNISDKNIARIIKTMKAFKLLMDVQDVDNYMACATSAMREANNASEVVSIVKSESGIKIEIIDGEREAEIVASVEIPSMLQAFDSYLHIDVGGGSTEFTFSAKGKENATQSFKLGTVRILSGLVPQSTWDCLQSWIIENAVNFPNLCIVGSGGNINKLHDLSGKNDDQPINIEWLKKEYNTLNGLSYHDRIYKIGLNPDRADVIVPAAKIFMLSAKWSGVSKIFAPKMGLADGIIQTLYSELRLSPN